MRHKEPILIYPYFEKTREEKIINSIYEQYKDVSDVTVIDEKRLKETYEFRKNKRKRKNNNAG